MTTSSDPLPTLENEKSYKQWRNAITMWGRVTDVKPEKQALVVALNLAGRARELALNIHVDNLHRNDGLEKLLNVLDLEFDRIEIFEKFQYFEKLHKSQFHTMDEYVSNFENLFRAVKGAIVACKLLRGSGLSEEQQEKMLCEAEELNFTAISASLRKMASETSGHLFEQKTLPKKTSLLANGGTKIFPKQEGNQKDIVKSSVKPPAGIFVFGASNPEYQAPKFNFSHSFPRKHPAFITRSPPTSKTTTASSIAAEDSSEIRFAGKNSTSACTPSCDAISQRSLKQDVKKDSAHSRCSEEVKSSASQPEYRLRACVRRVEGDTTGEEFEQTLFVARGKLYTYHIETKHWKERGTGKIKIVQNWRNHSSRVLMRREKLFKVCLNHCINDDIKLVFKDGIVENTLMWAAVDFSDGEKRYGQALLFAVRFADAKIAESFRWTWIQSLKAKTSKTILERDAAVLHGCTQRLNDCVFQIKN